jgi:hypothetical protein
MHREAGQKTMQATQTTWMGRQEKGKAGAESEGVSSPRFCLSVSQVYKHNKATSEKSRSGPKAAMRSLLPLLLLVQKLLTPAAMRRCLAAPAPSSGHCCWSRRTCGRRHPRAAAWQRQWRVRQGSPCCRRLRW